MKTDPNKQKASLRRRDVLRTLGLSAGVAAAGSGPLADQALADGATNDAQRKAQYQANSPDVQNYYRVNRYPK